ncbi:MAG: anthranilate/para-aminobenzoate synthase component II [Bacteriovoracaceae bacterium]|jgi:anthranilate/para-aminobenzoate synthase component II
MKILICDFEDSFTYNIFSELSEIFGAKCIKVVKKSSLLSLLQTLEDSFEKTVLILGPGPGHPNQYEYLHQPLLRLQKKNNIFMVGICLGHQILSEIYGASVSFCKRPIHGQSINYTLPESIAESISESPTIEVQRYNSLGVIMSQELAKRLGDLGHKTFVYEEELIIFLGDRILSYQFHPESIGTTCPKSFFKPVIKFLL